MPFDPLYLIVAVPAVLAVLGITVHILRHGVTLKRKDGSSVSRAEWDHLGQLLVVSFFRIGVAWMVIVALWGLKAGPGFSIIAAGAGFSTLAFGGFGGQWVGPGASDLRRKERQTAPTLLVGGVVWAVLSGLLFALFTFEGWSPWRPFGS